MAGPHLWRYIEDDGVEAASGLAADEFLMSLYAEPASGGSPTLRLYTYRSSCALVGRFQDLASELDLEACRREGIAVNRRPTGGGAIVMGSGQLGLALVGRLGEGVFPAHPASLFEELSRGVVEGLRFLGLEANFRPRNDIELAGKKVAGLGTTVDERGAVLFHTSLLVSLDWELLARALVVGEAKWKERAVSSFAERLTTVEAERPGTSLEEVRRAVRGGFERAFGVSANEQPWSDAEREAVGGLVAEKYATREWIYQPVSRRQARGSWQGRTAAGTLTVELALDGEVIKEARLAGDFFGSERAVRGLEAALKWQRADRATVARALKGAWSDGAILGASPEDLAGWVAEAASSVKAGAAAREVT